MPVSTEYHDLLLEASKLYIRGDYVGARRACLIATQILPLSTDAHALLANIDRSLEDFESSERSFRICLDLNPYQPIVLHSYAGLLVKMERLEEALKCSMKAIQLAPHSGILAERAGYILWKLGNVEKAIALSISALQNDSTLVTAALNLSSIYTECNEPEKAENVLIDAMRSNPESHLLKYNYSVCQYNRGFLEKSIIATREAISLSRSFPEGECFLSFLLCEIGKHEESLKLALEVTRSYPNFTQGWIQLTAVYLCIHDFARAEETARSLVSKTHDSPSLLILLATALREQGKLDEAHEFLLRAEHGIGADHELTLATASLLEAQGQVTEARVQLRTYLESGNSSLQIACSFSRLLLSESDANICIASLDQFKQSILLPKEQISYYFALARVSHYKKEYLDSASFLSKANSIKLGITGNDYLCYWKKTKLCSDKLINNSFANRLSNRNTKDGSGFVFIVGLPRCGSTLLESILLASADFKELGETNLLAEAIGSCSAEARSKSGVVGSLDEKLRELAGTFSGYLDKNLYNYVYIDSIIAYLPAAKIIHCRRHPLDQILSLYRCNLGSGSFYSSHLESTALLLVEQERCLNLYKEIAGDTMFTMRYEDLVESPSEWIDAVLSWLCIENRISHTSFYRQKRYVPTASSLRVRQPIDKLSVNCWIEYADLLKPASRIIHNSGLFSDYTF